MIICILYRLYIIRTYYYYVRMHYTAIVPPTYQLKTDFLEAQAGQTLTVHFTVISDPPLDEDVKHTLCKEGVALLGRRIKVQSNNIIFRNVRESDSGIYTISCCNDEGIKGEEIFELEISSSVIDPQLCHPSGEY